MKLSNHLFKIFLAWMIRQNIWPNSLIKLSCIRRKNERSITNLILSMLWNILLELACWGLSARKIHILFESIIYCYILAWIGSFMMVLSYRCLSFSDWFNFLALQLLRYHFNNRSILNKEVINIVVVNDVTLRLLRWCWLYRSRFFPDRHLIQSLLNLLNI